MNDNSLNNTNNQGNNQPVQPAQTVQPTQSAQTVQSIQTVQPAQPVQPVQPVQPAQPVQPVQPTQPTQPVQPVQPTQPTQPAQPAQPVQSVQPTQPTQPVQPTQPNQNIKLNIVNPLNPDEVIKTEELVEKQIPKADEENQTVLETNNQPKKKSNNLIIILLLIIVVIGIAAGVYFVFFNKSKPSPAPTPTPNEPVEEPETTEITLNDILNNFNNNSMIKQLQETNEINANIDNNKLIISVKPLESDTPTLYEYVLENRTLKTTINTSDLTANILFLVVADNIGQFHGTPENETYSLLSSVDFTAAQIDGIVYTINNENIDISINIDKKIDTSSLKTMYIETNDLKKYESFIKDSGSIQFDKGNLMFYKYGDNATSTIIIGEKDNLTNLTYKSILSIVEFLYPDELETFKTSYPELTTISFNRYTITENPELTGTVGTLFNQYSNQYKFIEIKINKD